MTKRFYLTTLLLISVMLLGCDQSNQEPSSILPSFVQQQSASLVITQGPLQMEILPNFAGRVSAFKLADHNVLVPIRDLNKPQHWGSVLWSSPQSEWVWPPIDVLDNHPYALSVSENSVVLTSDLDPNSGYQFSKSYSLSGQHGIAITYRIFNRSTKHKRVGALEVTRLPAEGDVFFPHGETDPTSGIFYPLDVKQMDGLSWYHYDEAKIRNDHHKLMEDGKEGWVAYSNKGYLLVKEFTDNPPDVIVDGEREVEIFAHVNHTFIEMKQQSAAADLAPGEHLEWTVIWRLVKLPPDLAQNAEPRLMADFVRELLQQ